MNLSRQALWATIAFAIPACSPATRLSTPAFAEAAEANVKYEKAKSNWMTGGSRKAAADLALVKSMGPAQAAPGATNGSAELALVNEQKGFRIYTVDLAKLKSASSDALLGVSYLVDTNLILFPVSDEAKTQIVDTIVLRKTGSAFETAALSKYLSPSRAIQDHYTREIKMNPRCTFDVIMIDGPGVACVLIDSAQVIPVDTPGVNVGIPNQKISLSQFLTNLKATL